MPQSVFLRFQRRRGWRWRRGWRLYSRCDFFLQWNTVVGVLELVLHVVFYILLHFDRCINGCNDTSDEGDVDAEANLHARGFKGDVRENGEGGKRDNSRLGGAAEAQYIPDLFFEGKCDAKQRKKREAEQGNIEKKYREAYPRMKEAESREAFRAPPQPLAREPREEYRNCRKQRGAV